MSPQTRKILGIGIAVLLIGGIAFTALRSTTSSNADQNVAQQAESSGPYHSLGPNASDDNFFIPSTVPSLASLADPEKKATVVWVSASWCEICHTMRRFVATVANKYADTIALKEIDYDQNPSIVREQGVYGTPAFFVLDREGQVIQRFSGATRDTFEAQLKKAS